MEEYLFEQGDFVIKDYQRKKTFTNFLPSISGEKGKPIWMFYLNRGQCVSSFGIMDKAHPILEFSPASISLERVSTQGFRTFIKVNKQVYEPFSVYSDNQTEMRMNNAELIIKEDNKKLDLSIEIKYFTMPEENFPSLIRRVKIKNNSSEIRKLEIYDGLAELIPYGLDNGAYKACGNLFRSWMSVENLNNQVPLYRLRSSTSDASLVEQINLSYFFLSKSSKGETFRIVDPSLIFGYDNSLVQPVNLLDCSFDKIMKEKQICENILPCAFIANKASLEPKQEIEIIELFGLNETGQEMTLDNKIIDKDFIDHKEKRNYQIIRDLEKDVDTFTSNKLFDKYVNQCYLDNFLRGGYPKQVGNKVAYIYSRKHGDLERDYNWFVIKPEYYSSGEGNYRDVLQNRRNDILFHPYVKDLNIRYFSSLIQTDGFNPLVVDGVHYKYLGNKDFSLPNNLLKDFTIGDLYKANENLSDKDLNEIITDSEEIFKARTGEGYWCDHFVYLLDIIESYQKIYPDQMEKLFNDKSYSYFVSLYKTNDYSHRFILINNQVRRLDLIVGKNEDEAKKENEQSHYLTVDNKIYQTSLFSKLFNLICIKFSSLDPERMGLDMDGGKPGWNDALNGLPGMIGSSFCDLIELYSLARFFKENYESFGKDLEVLKEQKQFILRMSNSIKLDNTSFYLLMCQKKDALRKSLSGGKSKGIDFISKDKVIMIINRIVIQLKKTIKKGITFNNNMVPSYFYYQVTKYQLASKDDKYQYVKPLEFKACPLPIFAEGVAKYLKTDLPLKEKYLKKYLASDGYDHRLKLVKVSSSLENESFEIGRIRSFSSGWLERESCFLHMNYKFLFGILKSGQYQEFYHQITSNMVPFMDPKVYGRSTLENSSFIATSNFVNKKIHGQGFQPRLSGANAEFLSMWFLMFVGDKAFSYDNQNLSFTLEPKLDKSFFDENNQVSFTLLSSTKVTYINENKVDTFDTKIKRIIVDYNNEKIEIKGNALNDHYSHLLRDGKITSLTCYF